MRVHVQVGGLHGGKYRSENLETDLTEGSSLGQLFRQLDRSKSMGRNFFRKLVRAGRATIMVNGQRVDLPEGLERELVDEDRVSVLAPIAGG